MIKWEREKNKLIKNECCWITYEINKKKFIEVLKQKCKKKLIHKKIKIKHRKRVSERERKKEYIFTYLEWVNWVQFMPQNEEEGMEKGK